MVDGFSLLDGERPKQRDAAPFRRLPGKTRVSVLTWEIQEDVARQATFFDYPQRPRSSPHGCSRARRRGCLI